MKTQAWALGWLAAAGMAAALAGCRGRSGEAAGGRPGMRGGPVAVETTAVVRTNLAATVDLVGSLRADLEFVVAPKIAGRVRSLLADIGDAVTNGQVLATLDDEEYVEQVEQGRAALAVARAGVQESQSNLEIARKEFARVQTLSAQKIASPSEQEAAEADLRVREARHNLALAQVDQAQAALRAAEVRLSYTRISAEWTDGGAARLVGERFVDEGATLRANDPIVSVLLIDRLTAAVTVNERDYARVRPGLDVELSTDAYPGRPFSGRTARVAPLLRESTREAEVEIEVPNPDRLLKPGFFVRAAIRVAAVPDAAVVPRSALVRRDGKEGVFRLADDGATVRFIAVTTGIVRGDLAQVVSPALDGAVVSLGQHLLEDGSAVLLPGAAPRGAAEPRAAGSVAP